jgi:hypothetical protein
VSVATPDSGAELTGIAGARPMSSQGEPPAERSGSEITRTTGSFLVRIWLEPREDGVDDPVVRGYARNLKTGEEQYFVAEGFVVSSLLAATNGLQTKEETEAVK